MTNQSGKFPGMTAPQAQLIQLRKRLTSLSTQLNRLSAKAHSSPDEQVKNLLSRAKANAMTALSLGEAVDNIASQTALDLLVAPNNDVKINVALTAFEDVPDINNLKPLATAVAAAVLQADTSVVRTDSLDLQQPKRFACCSPDPQKWFGDGGRPVDDKKTGGQTAIPGGANTCAQPSYLTLTLPVNVSTSQERIAEFLNMGELLVAVAQAQLGQARESVCHAGGKDTCSLF